MRLLVTTIALILLLSAPKAGTAQVDQIILVLWHGLEWEQIKDLCDLEPLALGIMNTRSGGGSEPSASYLSIGAGARTVGFSGAEAFTTVERAGDIFLLRTGKEPTPFIQPEINLIQAAQTVNYTMKLGALGSALANRGMPARVLGSSDAEMKGSWAALAAMDEWGRVWLGEIGDHLLTEDITYPYGLRTDYARLSAEVLRAGERLVVVDLGDPFRFDQYQKFLTAEQREKLQGRMVSEAKAFIHGLSQSRRDGTVIFVVSPHPGRERAELGLWLTPVLCIGLEGGLLTSGTTHWPGLIANIDIAPTILALLNIDYSEPFLGREAVITAHPDPFSHLVKTQERLEHVNQQRGLVLRGVISLQIALHGACLIVLIISRPSSSIISLFQRLLTGFLVLPLAFVLLPASFWLILVLAAAFLFLEYACKDLLVRVGIIAGVTTVVVALDVLGGSWLLRFSYLGYDAIAGARFYGIGNELMGFLVGTTVLCLSVLWQKGTHPAHLKWLSPILFLSVLVVIGAPSLGTNVGGAISAVFAFGYTWLELRGQKTHLGRLLALCAAVVAVLALLMLVDQGNHAGEQSHIGQTVGLIKRDGILAIRQIITRKLAMNLRLLRYSVWSRALVMAIAAMGASFIWPSTFIAWLKKDYPFIAIGMRGIAIGSLAAFIFNDSGVVAAATCLYFASSTQLLLALRLKHDLNASESHV